MSNEGGWKWKMDRYYICLLYTSITTSAKPEAIKEIFRRAVDTGIEHGTVTVMIGKDSYEVTTYRIDGAYEDSRHPKEVRFRCV